MRRALLLLALVALPASATRLPTMGTQGTGATYAPGAATVIGLVGAAQDAANNATTPLNVTGVSTANANALLVLVAEGITQNGSDTQGVTSITGGGLTWALAARQHNGWNIYTEIWYAQTTSTLSSQTIAVNLTGNNQELKQAWIYEVTGARSGASAIGNTATVPLVSSGQYQVSVGTVSSGSAVILGLFSQYNNSALTAVSGYTQDATDAGTGRERVGNGTNALVGYTNTAAQPWTAVAVEILAQ